MVERGVLPGARLLDAGCGTGRYARELGRRGYVVEGIDLSSELIALAKASTPQRDSAASFSVGDILQVSGQRYDGILCRGVLNDVLEDHGREAVLAAFARALRPPGILILDVREWGGSAERKTREPLFRKSVDTERGRLTFTSVTTLDRENRKLLLAERHVLVADGAEHSSACRFVMRCWTLEELRGSLRRSGFDRVAYFGAYDPGVESGATDRVIAVAQRGEGAL
jgi:SAM-dependent methyltransferase